MKWHYENETDKNVAESFIVYLNDDFEGGLLEFKYKDYKVKPKRGMLINIPVTEEFTHRVTPVSKNDRITFYGNCFYDLNNVIFTEVC
jgi:predicted 2-oxoglutarate/Fe(II)-dependent dioxygenase YbiX